MAVTKATRKPVPSYNSPAIALVADVTFVIRLNLLRQLSVLTEVRGQ